MSDHSSLAHPDDLADAANSYEDPSVPFALRETVKSLAGQYVDILDNPSHKVRERVEDLRGLQSLHDELEAKFLEERAALEAKYQKLYQPLYTKRYEIVNGIAEVKGDTDKAQTDREKVTEGKGVPDFWLTAMKTNEKLTNEITERDKGALKYLKDTKWNKLDDPRSFKLEFFFSANPYFKNSVLTKTYHIIDYHDSVLGKAIGTEIEWHPGKNLTHKILKKWRKKRSENARPITNTEQCDSFFNFFNPPQISEKEDIDDDVEEYQNLMRPDFDIGCTIRDKVIPHAVSWFTGEAVDKGALNYGFDEDEDKEQEGEDWKERYKAKTDRVKFTEDLWLTAMKTNEKLTHEITERDEEALKYLKDIKTTKLDDPKGFKLEFIFSTNPYFKNSVLTKTYHTVVLEKAIGTEIEWYPKKSMTHKILKRKPKKKPIKARPITNAERRDSFFNFFNPPQITEKEDIDDDADAKERQNLLRHDYDIGCTIRDKIVPHALRFTGEAVCNEFEYLEADEDDYEEDDEVIEDADQEQQW